MFDFLFGWRKASKCKKLIKQVQCRIKLLKNKRAAIAKLLKDDVHQLILNGYHQTAFNRVEQIVIDEKRMGAYEILDNFCEFILLNLSYIRKHKECPNDVNEAVSSLIFASARCGDLPELQLIRKLFVQRYGSSFENAALELTSDNLVNCQIKEKLLTNSVSDDEKVKMMSEIATDWFQPEILALQYCADWHHNQVLARGVEVHNEEKTDQHRNQALKANKTKIEKKQANSTTSTSSESLPQFPEDRIVYLDDVTELCPSTNTHKDQRLFKFKTHNYNTQTDADQTQSSSKSSPKTEDNHQNQKFEYRIKGNNFRREENWDSEEATDKEKEWSNFYNSPRRRRKRRELKPSSVLIEAKDTKLSSLRNKRDALYLRAVTMPQERPKESKKVNFGRTNSCPYKQPSHVHPKLPDYDDIAAKFMALKREHLHFKS